MAQPYLMSSHDVWALRQHADSARDFVQGLEQDPRPGMTETERTVELTYAAAVEDVLRWVVGDAPASSLLATILDPDGDS